MAKTIIENTPLELYVFDPEAGNIRYYTKSEIQVSASNNNVVLSPKGGGTSFFSKPLTEIDTPSTTPVNSLAAMVKLIHGWITTASPDGFSGGWADYADTATVGTPINVTAVPAVLTNNGLGVDTNTTYLPVGRNGITQLWDTSSNGFDFSDLNVGDMVDIRMDISVIIALTNTVVDVNLLMGTGGSVVVPFISDQNYKATGTFEVIRYMGIYIGSTDVRDTLAQLKIEADKSCTCIVHGWYIKAIRRG